MCVLVTGAGGFIGQAVVTRLTRGGLQTTALLGPGDPDVTGPTRTVRGDIRDPDVVSDALRGASGLIHLAGPASVADSFADPPLFASVHAVGTAVLFEAARRAHVSRAVLVSSAEVYGEPQACPVSETAPTAPCSPYGAAKLAGEAVASVLLPEGLTIVRPFSVYGCGMRTTSLLGRILRQVLAGDSVTVESLEPVRDYIHVEDLAELIHLALKMEVGACPRVLNACSGAGVSVRRLIELSMQATGSYGPSRELALPRRRPRDIRRLVGDPTAALSLGWRGARPLTTGIGEVAQSWRVQPWA